jgi:hypothetical protein
MSDRRPSAVEASLCTFHRRHQACETACGRIGNQRFNALLVVENTMINGWLDMLDAD